MPQVPTIDGPQVRPQGIPSVREPIDRSPDEFGAGVGRGLQQAGNMGLQLYEQEKRRADQIAVSEFEGQASEIQTNEELGVQKVKGKDALGAIDKAIENFDQSTGTLIENLGNERQKEAARRLAQSRRQSLRESGMRYAQAQMTAYDNATTESLLKNLRQEAVLHAADPVRIQSVIDKQKAAIRDYASPTRNGIPPERTDEMIAATVSATHVGVATTLIADASYDLARSYVANHKDEIQVEDRLRLQGMLKERSEHDRSDLRVSLSDRFSDLQAMAINGVVLPKDYIKPEEIDAAFSEKESNRKAAFTQDVKRVYAFADKSRLLRQMPNEEIVAYVTQTLAPNPSDPDSYSEAVQEQQQLASLGRQYLEERLTEPITYAQKYGVDRVEPLTAATSAQLASQLVAREKTAKMMRDRFSSPIKLMTTQEAAAVASSFNEMTSVEKGSYLRTLRSAIRDDESYASVMQQIRPDSPVTASVGQLLQRGSRTVEVGDAPGWFTGSATMTAAAVADRILEGEALLNPTKGDKATDGKPKIVMPTENDLLQAWNDQVGLSYRNLQDQWNVDYQSFRAFYAAEASRAGERTGRLDAKIAERAARAVSGGTMRWYDDKPILLPWGMSRDQFTANISAAWPSVLKAYGLPSSIPVTEVGLDVLEPGRYVVTTGDAPLRSPDGRMVMFEVTDYGR